MTREEKLAERRAERQAEKECLAEVMEWKRKVNEKTRNMTADERIAYFHNSYEEARKEYPWLPESKSLVPC